jgi:hypothetical protein
MIAAATLAGVAAEARMLDPAKSEDALEINKRITCGVADGVPAVYYFSGQVWSRVQGEPDRHVFNTEAMNIRQCVPATDAKRGKGYRMVSREVLFYTDPKTNAVLREWANPWTGETVPIMHVNNDPVNGRPSFPVTADGKPYTIKLKQVGPWSQTSGLAPLFYTNPLAGDYQDYVGGNYHAMEMLTSSMLTSDLLDTAKPTVYPAISWTRVSVWLPWMKMRGRQGQLVFQSSGAKVKSYADLPAVVRDEIAANYPAYTAPPPGDDPRPNETTWTVFKKWADARAKAGAK